MMMRVQPGATSLQVPLLFWHAVSKAAATAGGWQRQALDPAAKERLHAMIENTNIRNALLFRTLDHKPFRYPHITHC
jgi:hypothetical protein